MFAGDQHEDMGFFCHPDVHQLFPACGYRAQGEVALASLTHGTTIGSVVLGFPGVQCDFLIIEPIVAYIYIEHRGTLQSQTEKSCWVSGRHNIPCDVLHSGVAENGGKPPATQSEYFVVCETDAWIRPSRFLIHHIFLSTLSFN